MTWVSAIFVGAKRTNRVVGLLVDTHVHVVSRDETAYPLESRPGSQPWYRDHPCSVEELNDLMARWQHAQELVGEPTRANDVLAYAFLGGRHEREAVVDLHAIAREPTDLTSLGSAGAVDRGLRPRSRTST